MTFDYAEHLKEQQAKEEKAKAEIAAVTVDLERILADPSPDMPAFERQADLLDCLLYAVMRHNLNQDKQNGYFDSRNLEFALRIQKQCLETLKASAAVEYMQSIASARSGVYPAHYAPAIIPHPLPPANDERTE